MMGDLLSRARRSLGALIAGPVMPSASAGRHVARRSASYQGTLANYVVSVVNARMAERQKRLSADRAVDLYVNSSMAHGLLESALAEVVGTGLTPQPAPMLGWLGLDGTWGKEWSARCADWFELVGLDPRNWADAQRRQTLYGLQALAYFNWKLEGLAAFQVVNLPVAGSPVKIRFLPICPSRIRTPGDAKGDVYDGVEVDKTGAPVAIHVAPEAAYFSSVSSFNAADMARLEVWDTKTGLPKVLLVTGVRNIAEYRQDGILSSVLKDIRDAEDFREAALVKALIANLFAIFIEESSPLGASLGTTSTGGAGQTVNDWGGALQELERGLIIQGGPGQKPTVIPNDAPGPNHQLMLDDVHTAVGIATGRGKENVTRRYDASYSASQMSVENAERLNEVERQNGLVAGFCQPAWMWHVLEGVASGRLPYVPQTKLLANLYAYTRAAWIRPPARAIDKLKIANADDVRLANGTKTRSDIWSEQGADWRVKMRQAAEEEAERLSLAREYDLGDGWLQGKSSAPSGKGPSTPEGTK